MPKSLQGEFLGRIKSVLPHREDVIVAGREIKGALVIHPVIATAMLGAIVMIGLSIRSEMNWQHDQIVIIRTQKEDAQVAADKDQAREQLANSTRDARIQNLEVKLAVKEKGKN